MKYKIDPHSDNIILISYQSGSYGHFLYYVLTHFFDKTVKIHDDQFVFDSLGTAHLLKNYCKVWYEFDIDEYPLDIAVPYSADEKILILCDHGHRCKTDNYDELKRCFSNAKILRVTTSGAAEPVMYNTYLVKCKESHNIPGQNNKHVQLNWNTTEDWAVRENFTLWYHNECAPQFSAKDDPNIINLDLAELIINTTQTLMHVGDQLGLSVIDYKKLLMFCKHWHRIQNNFFSIISTDRRLQQSLGCDDIGYNLSHVTSLHDQGYLNYKIEKRFNVCIPVYDYRNWFRHSDEIKEMLVKLEPKKHND